jgi:hypothetical protein
MTPLECLTALGTSEPRVKLAFYINLASQLTLAGRSIWSDESVSIAERLDRMKWVNEAMHRVLNRATDLHHQHDRWTEEEMWRTLRHTAEQNPAIQGELGGAILRAHAQTQRQTQPSARE